LFDDLNKLAKPKSMGNSAPARWSILLSLMTPVAFAEAADDPQDKSRYNLFHPTPDNLLRELATDRPDKTESPTTVDAGHFQFEMDFATFTHHLMIMLWRRPNDLSNRNAAVPFEA
jgi:hypothetical protein